MSEAEVIEIITKNEDMDPDLQAFYEQNPDAARHDANVLLDMLESK